jgi:exosortase/archaeosortase family protein
MKWQSLRNRLLLIVLAVPLAILINIVRITGTAFIANYWNAEYAMGFFHSFSGWLVFVVAIVLLFATAALIQLVLPSEPPAQADI